MEDIMYSSVKWSFEMKNVAYLNYAWNAITWKACSDVRAMIFYILWQTEQPAGCWAKQCRTSFATVNKWKMYGNSPSFKRIIPSPKFCFLFKVKRHFALTLSDVMRVQKMLSEMYHCLQFKIHRRECNK